LVKSFESLLSVVFSGFLFHSLDNSVVRVQGFHDLRVGQGVLLGFMLGFVGSDLTNDALDFIGVDDSSNIGVFEDGSVQLVSGLFLGRESVGSEDLVEGLEGRFSPDDESSQMTTGSELLKVKSVDIADVNSWDVSDSLEDVGIFVVVDEERSLSDLVSLVSELSNTGSQSLGGIDSFNIFISTDSLQEGNSFLGLFNSFNLIVDDEGQVGDVGDSVTSGKDEGSDSGGSKSRGNSVSLLLKVDLSVPSSPGLKGSEHSSLSAHVTEGTLTRSVGTATTNSGNSGNGTTGTPGFSGVLHTGILLDSVSLSNVLGDLIVNELDNIKSNGSSADFGERNLSSDFLRVGEVENADGGSS